MDDRRLESPGVHTPEEIDRMMRQEGRGRRRLLIVFFVGMSMVVYSWGLLTIRSLIVNTDWRSVVPGQLVLNGVFAFFLAIPVGLLFTLGYLVARRCFRHSRRWMVSSVMPLLVGALILGVAIWHRVDSRVLFRDVLGLDLPSSARQVSHSYDESILEEFGKVTFVADQAEILELLEALRVEGNPSLGLQVIDSVPCKYDHAGLTIDWTKGEVLLEYLDV